MMSYARTASRFCETFISIEYLTQDGQDAWHCTTHV